MNSVTSSINTHENSVSVESDNDKYSATESDNPKSQLTSDRRVNITAIVLDDSYFGRVKKDPELIESYVESYLLGQEFPPIVIKKDSNKLIDGYHRYKALMEIKNRYDNGELDDSIRKLIMPANMIRVEYVIVPDDIVPCLFSLKFNLTHGKKASCEDIKYAVERQFQLKPDYSVQQLAKNLGMSEDTARRYADPYLKAFKEEIREVILNLNREGKTQDEIEGHLRNDYPDARGISQATISKILSEDRQKRETDKQGVGVDQALALHNITNEFCSDSNAEDEISRTGIVSDNTSSDAIGNSDFRCELADDEPLELEKHDKPDASPVLNSNYEEDKVLELVIARLHTLDSSDRNEILGKFVCILNEYEASTCLDMS